MKPIGIVDEETRKWPMSSELSDTMAILKYTHEVKPLLVYNIDNTFIDPQHVPAKLENALVEVYFQLNHYYIGISMTDPAPFNSFVGTIQQIMILHPGHPKTANWYQQNRCAGLKWIKLPVVSTAEHMAKAFVPKPLTEGHDESAVGEYTSPKLDMMIKDYYRCY